jgi:cytoskeleton protein RodZ
VSEPRNDGPGSELKTAREGMEVSTREVADALNLPIHVIEALEGDDYERLPPSVFRMSSSSTVIKSWL